MRLAFLGTPEAAVPSLQALVAAGHEVVVVITRPERRRGRSEAPSLSPVHRAAADLGLPVAHDLAALEGCGAERAVVVAFGALIPAALLERLPMLNVHFSLLPRWRGAAPVERAILAGDERTGVCVMSLEASLDTGPVHLCRELEIGEARADELTRALAELGARALVEVLERPDLLEHPRPQEGEATYAAKLSAEDFHLTPEMARSQVLRVVRLGRAFTLVSGRRLRVLRARRSDLSGEPGRVLEGAAEVALAVSDGAVALEEVVPDGGSSMDGAAWWRGARLDAETAWWA